MMDVNLWAILICAVVSLVIGSVWYGPIFGKMWMRVCGMTSMDEARRKQMQKESMPLYFVQFILSLFTAWVLSLYIVNAIDEMTGISNAFWIWAGFVMPTVAGGVMWTADSGKVKWTKFLLQAAYYLITFIVFALIIVAMM